MGEAEPLAGRVLAEKYLLIDRLGEGGFGSIWRAEHQTLKSKVAVKLIDLDMARKEGAVERFLREAQATAALRSPHVVQVLDYGVDGDQPFIVMELLEGENLAERIERCGALSPLEAVRIVTHVARAIGKAHELGIVHRDLKPENIFLVNNGDEEVAKVLDFGVAKIAAPVDINQDTYTITGSLIGTPYYMSPEQAQGNKTVDHRSDLWALGVIAFEMLTAKRPFDGEALGDLVLTICVRSIAIPSAVAPVPAGFDLWFAKAVERDPEARFQSARELALALLQVVEDSDGTGTGEIRYTNVDDHGGPKASPVDSGIGVDIPSRPVASAFALTVRDEVLTAGMLAGKSGVTAPDERSLPGRISIHLASEEPEEEHLTPWSLAGIAILALAAGAAAVYGLFFLLRAHESSNDGLAPDATMTVHQVSPAATSIPTRQRFDVTATNRPNGNADAPTGKPRTLAVEPAASAHLPATAIAEPTPPATPPSPSPTTNTPTTLPPPEPAIPSPPTAPAAPPENLAPEAPPVPLPTPLPALSGETQTMALPGAPAQAGDVGMPVTPATGLTHAAP